MCHVTAFKLLLLPILLLLLLLNVELPLSQSLQRHLGNIKVKLGDRNGLFEGLYVSRSYHKPSFRWPNSSGNGAWQQSVETHTISMSQVNGLCGSGENNMEPL